MDLTNKRINLKEYKITDAEQLDNIEEELRNGDADELLPWAKNTPYREIAELVIGDKSGKWVHPLILIRSLHSTSFGLTHVLRKAYEYLDKHKEGGDIDVLSLSAYVQDTKIVLVTLVRTYNSDFHFSGFFEFLGDELVEEINPVEEVTSGVLIVPDEVKNFALTDDEIAERENALQRERKLLENCTDDKPFLNSLTKFTPFHLPRPEDDIDLTYDLRSKDKKMAIHGKYEDFIEVFHEILKYVNGTEYYSYVNVMVGEKSEEEFLGFLKDYLMSNYVETGRFYEEDVPAMMDKLNNALFKLYIVQQIIDDPDVSDIKITGPDSIRCRVKGKAYMSNIKFIDRDDFLRFINGICLRSRIRQNLPQQTFTYRFDNNYILRMTLYAEYVTSEDWPYLHIRKVDRNKMSMNDLVEAGMMTPIVKDYLLDCGKTSRGIVFAGPPGSGKTIALNAFFEEAYEQSAEIMVIQENDELFAYRKGVMFEHIVKYSLNDELPVDLEELGRLALVAGANVFVIGETKGPEICSAITLSNAGCRTAMTIHANSAKEVPDKMADLARRGFAQSLSEAKRSLRAFQTLVYLEDFQVKEIYEVLGFDDSKDSLIFRCIYKLPGYNRDKQAA